MVKLTVFTPTYNRKNLIKRVYDSLCAQTCQDFVWLIVDDGSQDDTKTVVEGFMSATDGHGFEIQYFYQANGGKMRAHNTGVKLCNTELFVCLDSDDIFSADTVELILKSWQEHCQAHHCLEGSKKRAGIVAYKGEASLPLEDMIHKKSDDSDIKRFRDASFPAKDIEKGYSGLSDLYRHGFFGETTLVFVTELLKKYLFPEIKGEKYVPEDYIYDKIDEECPLLVVPRVFTVCELMEGGYTDVAPKLRKDNPTGWFLYYEQRAHRERWSVLKIKYISHYMRFCQVLDKRPELGVLEYATGLPGMLMLWLLKKT